MKGVTLLLHAADGFHPANQALAEEDLVTRVAIHHLQLLDDETVVLLYELHGDLARAEEILSTHPKVNSCQVSGVEAGVAFIHCHPTSLGRSLLHLPQSYELALDLPIEHVEGHGVRVTLVAEQSVLQDALSEIPTEVNVSLERIKDYRRSEPIAPALLTPRQRDIVDVALREGYYDIPRGITQQEIANRFGITSGTVAEHFRKIEQRTIEHVFGPAKMTH